VMRGRIQRALSRHTRASARHGDDFTEAQLSMMVEQISSRYFASADYAQLRSHCLANVRIWCPQTPRALLAALLQIDDACGKYNNATWEHKQRASVAAAASNVTAAESQHGSSSHERHCSGGQGARGVAAAGRGHGRSVRCACACGAAWKRSMLRTDYFYHLLGFSLADPSYNPRLNAAARAAATAAAASARLVHCSMAPHISLLCLDNVTAVLNLVKGQAIGWAGIGAGLSSLERLAVTTGVPASGIPSAHMSGQDSNRCWLYEMVAHTLTAIMQSRQIRTIATKPTITRKQV
jgi:hypothetical protein